MNSSKRAHSSIDPNQPAASSSKRTRQSFPLLDLPEPIVEHIIELLVKNEMKQNSATKGVPYSILPVSETCKTLRLKASKVVSHILTLPYKANIARCAYTPLRLLGRKFIRAQEMFRCECPNCKERRAIVGWTRFALPFIYRLDFTYIFDCLPEVEALKLIQSIIDRPIQVKEMKLSFPLRGHSRHFSEKMLQSLGNLLSTTSDSINTLTCSFSCCNPTQVIDIINSHKFPNIKILNVSYQISVTEPIESEVERFCRIMDLFKENENQLEELNLTICDLFSKYFHNIFEAVPLAEKVCLELKDGHGKIDMQQALEHAILKTNTLVFKNMAFDTENLNILGMFISKQDSINSVQFKNCKIPSVALCTTLIAEDDQFGPKITELDISQDLSVATIGLIKDHCSNMNHISLYYSNQLQGYTTELCRFLQQSKKLKAISFYVDENQPLDDSKQSKQLTKSLIRCQSRLEELNVWDLSLTMDQVCEIIDSHRHTLRKLVFCPYELSRGDKALKDIFTALDFIFERKTFFELRSVAFQLDRIELICVDFSQEIDLVMDIHKLLGKIQTRYDHFDAGNAMDEVEAYVRKRYSNIVNELEA